MFVLNALFLACTPGEKTDEGTIQNSVYVDWGSWEITTTFVQESEICNELGANGQEMDTLYGEMTTDTPDYLSMSLGSVFLEGMRNRAGFILEGWQSIPVTGVEDPDTYGIATSLSAEVESRHAWEGALNYTLDFPDGVCEIDLDVVAEWMYYEPPPDCGG